MALDDLTDVDAPTPSVGDVLTFDGADWVSQAPSVGGSSFTTFSPDVPPGSPSALDDRFPGSSLDGKWTTVDNNAGGVFTAAVNDGLLLRHNPNSFGKIATLLQAIPGGVTDFTVACQCVASAESAQYGWAGICMTDGATTASKLIMVANQGRELLGQGVSMEVQYFTDYNTFNTQLASITHAAPFKYFSIRRVSSTYYVGFSRDGIAWAERTITPAFTPTHLGIASAGDQGNTWSFEASARWFQFDGVSGTRRFGDAITVAY